MARNVYITAVEAHSGKSVVALGLMGMLSARVERVGFFRPIVPSGSQLDSDIELMRSRYRLPASHDEMRGLTTDETSRLFAAGDHNAVKKRVVEAYRELERNCDFIVCEGTDFTGAARALDFDLNAELANELAAPTLAVLRGGPSEQTVAAVNLARESFAYKGCDLLGVIVNRLPEELLEQVTASLASQNGQEPVYVLPESAELAHPTVGEVAAALEARTLFDPGDKLSREVRDVRVAAMSVEHFIDELAAGTLVIVPGDRPDILIASLASALSPAFPAIAGIVLTGGYELASSVRRLLKHAPFPVLEVDEGTYATATAVRSVRAVITAETTRKIATALGVFEAGVDAFELQHRISLERPARVTPTMFEYEVVEQAKASRRHIVLPEGEDDRVLAAADILLRRDVVDITILGTKEDVMTRAGALGLDLRGVQIIDPLSSPLRRDFAAQYQSLRAHKGISEEVSFDAMGDPSYFGSMMVHVGAVDGMVSGAAHTTGDTIRPAFEFIRAKPGVAVVSSVFLMCLPDQVLVYGDCAVNPKPNAEQLAAIAISSAETAEIFGIAPRIAMLSYSTGESGKGDEVDKVRAATALVREQRPDLKVEGPIQYDAAVDATVARLKMPGSEVAGRATVFIFPDLDTGNVAYKAVQRSANAVAVGPVLQGLNKPVNDLSRGCSVTDIVNTVAITAIQAQGDLTEEERDRSVMRTVLLPVAGQAATR